MPHDPDGGIYYALVGVGKRHFVTHGVRAWAYLSREIIWGERARRFVFKKDHIQRAMCPAQNQIISNEVIIRLRVRQDARSDLKTCRSVLCSVPPGDKHVERKSACPPCQYYDTVEHVYDAPPRYFRITPCVSKCPWHH